MPTNKSWERNFPKVREFAKQNGHCNIPSSGTTRYLAKWLGRIRKNPNSLDYQRKSQLEKLGVDWQMQKDRYDVAWNDMFQRLLSYKEKHGDCDVPLQHDDDPELGVWVANQRKRERLNKLKQDRKELLNSQGFRWSDSLKGKRKNKESLKYQEKWLEMFEKLKIFKQEHGHCIVPYNYAKDASLGMWVQTQRRVYNKKTFMCGEKKEMSEYRKELLTSIGFAFESQRQRSEGNNSPMHSTDDDDDNGNEDHDDNKNDDGDDNGNEDYDGNKNNDDGDGDRNEDHVSESHGDGYDFITV
mmetsp:Transcript_16033/g.30260  ORF Transcript_16033/g.30260 Transcript_16033/m.30260 type:complete len:299 (+) Transcript_16033:308-1204(+)